MKNKYDFYIIYSIIMNTLQQHNVVYSQDQHIGSTYLQDQHIGSTYSQNSNELVMACIVKQNEVLKIMQTRILQLEQQIEGIGNNQQHINTLYDKLDNHHHIYYNAGHSRNTSKATFMDSYK